MTLLLAPDHGVLYPPALGVDAHGWATSPESTHEAIWAGPCNLQMGVGVTNVDAAQGGGHGPFDPASVTQGEVYLPSDCGARNGSVLVSNSAAYTLGSVRLVNDPIHAGNDCVVATVSEVESWLPARSL